MNTIAYFPASVDYPEVDVVNLRQSSSSARTATTKIRQLFIQTRYLPTLHDVVVRVDSTLRDADFKLRETVQALDSKISINVRTLRGYQQELIGASNLDRKEILEDIDQQVVRIIHLVSKDQTALNRLLSPLSEPVDRVATGQYLVQLMAEQERLPQEVQEIKEREAALTEKREALTQAMALIESKGFAEVGKDTMLNAEALRKLALAGPEALVVEKGIELAQKFLETLESLVNYLGLMEARNILRKQIDDLITRTWEKTNELRLVDMKRDQIEVSHQFDEHRINYVGELANVIASTDSFLSVYKRVNPEDDSTVSQFALDAEALASHLKVVV
jgi:riboflavin biosynthesis pyrimidine reductase